MVGSSVLWDKKQSLKPTAAPFKHKAETGWMQVSFHAIPRSGISDVHFQIDFQDEVCGLV
jgi:hypothetical protein